MRRIATFLMVITTLLLTHVVHANPTNSVQVIRSELTNGTIKCAGGFLWHLQTYQAPADVALSLTDDFLALSPTITQINQFLKTYGYTTDAEVYLKLKRYGFARKTPQTIKQFFELVDFSIYGIGEPTTAYKTGLTQLVQDHLTLFISLHPSSKELNQLIRQFPSLEIGILNAIKHHRAEQVSEHPHSTQAFFSLLKESKKDSSTEIYAMVDAFLALSPTLEEIYQFQSLYSPGGAKIGDVIKLKRNGLERKLPKTTSQFLLLVDPLIRKINATSYQKELTALTKEYLDLFVSLDPSIQDCAYLTKVFPGLKKDLSILLTQRMREWLNQAQLQSAQECLTFLEQHSHSFAGQQVTPALDHFLSFSPTFDELLQFHISPMTAKAEDIIRFKRYGFERKLPKTAHQFLLLVNWITTSAETSYRHSLTNLVKDHVDQFMMLQPTQREAIHLLQQFPQLDEGVARLLPLFSNEKIVQVASEFPNCAPALSAHSDFYNTWSRNKDIEAISNLRKVACIQIVPDTAPPQTAKERYITATNESHQSYYKGQIEGQCQKTAFELHSLQYKERKECLLKLEKSLDSLVTKAQKSYETVQRQATSKKKKWVKWRIPTQIASSMQLTDIPAFTTTQTTTTETASSTECSICEGDMTDKVTLSSCGHSICKECFSAYVHDKFIVNTLSIPCFSNGCHCLLQEGDLRKATLSEQQLARWKKSTLLQHLPHAFECPREDCNEVFSSNTLPKKGNALCAKCRIEICSKCHHAAHLGERCINSDEGFKELQKKKIVQNCPFCKTPTIRISNCLHMDCPQCHTRWNYKGKYRETTHGIE